MQEQHSWKYEDGKETSAGQELKKTDHRVIKYFLEEDSSMKHYFCIKYYCSRKADFIVI